MVRTFSILTSAIVVVACSSSSSGTSSSSTTFSVSCKQKAGADTDKECAGVSGKPRKLDCDASRTSDAVNVGCTPTAPGESDVCCPTTVLGIAESESETTTVACTEKAGADTDKDCLGVAGKPRKLDCDADKTSSAVSAGCTPTKPGDSDVCCPATIHGNPG